MKSVAIVVLRSAGWLALCCGFAYAIFLIELEWNFLAWTPEMSGKVVGAFFIHVFTLTGVFVLARADRSRVTRTISGAMS